MEWNKTNVKNATPLSQTRGNASVSTTTRSANLVQNNMYSPEKNKNKKEGTASMETKEVKPGDVFVTSWGYDQTNYDYIVVKTVSPTGKTAVCQRASHEHMGTTFQDNIQRPTQNGFGDEFRLQVRFNGNGHSTPEQAPEVHLAGSYPFCHTGKGSKRYGYFSRWDGKQNFYETDSMFGH